MVINSDLMEEETIADKKQAAKARSSAPSSSQLIEKVAALIEHLAEHGASKAADISVAIDEPRSSVYRLLRYLDNVGWIIPGRSSGSWELSVQLFRLGSRAVNRLDFTRAVRPLLEELHERSGQTVYLCVTNQLEAVCIDRIEGLHVTSLELRLGGSLPLHLGAAPMALLAFAPKELRARWENFAREFGASSHSSRPQSLLEVLERIESVQELGYSISDEDVTIGISSVGAPVFDHTGATVAAVSISGLTDQILGPGSHAVEQVVRTARMASEVLGHVFVTED
jgi:DNA-binding IclR family transcriptional regulator